MSNPCEAREFTSGETYLHQVVQPRSEDVLVLAEERAKGDADDHVVQDEPYAIMEPAQKKEVSLPSHLVSATANTANGPRT